MGEERVLLLSTLSMITTENTTYIGVQSRLQIWDCNNVDSISVGLLLQAISLLEEPILTGIILSRY